MKKNYIGFAGLSLLLALGTQQVQAQQGFGTSKPDKTAAVDIQSSQRGLLIPRVNLDATTNGTNPINTPAQSLMVYNLATENDVTPGYYYWETDRWVRFAKQSEITAINLAGDVTGPTNATVVSAIQGKPVFAGNPTANQVLTFVPAKDGKDAHWAPISIIEDMVTSSKGITSNTLTVVGGANSTLKDVTLNIKPGNAGQVLVTSQDGSSTNWVDQSVISPTTTNSLTKKTVDGLVVDQNILVSNVNGVTSESPLIDNVTNTIEGSKIITTVNGKSSEPFELKNAIQVGQKTTSVKDGSTKVTVVTTGAGTTANNTEYTVDVVEANLNLANIGGTLPTNKLANGNNGQVLVTKDNVPTWVDQPTVKKIALEDGTNTTVDDTDRDGITYYSVHVSNEAIQAAQKTSSVVGEGNITVVSNTDNGLNTEYRVSVSNEAIQTAQKTSVVAAGAGVTVVPTIAEQVTTYTISTNSSAMNLAGDVTGNAGDTKVEGIQGVMVNPIKPTEGQTLVYNDTNKQWIPGTPNIGVTNITDGKTLTTDGVIVIGDNSDSTLVTKEHALLADVKLNIGKDKITANHIATGAVTTDEILNGTVLPEDLSASGNKGDVLTVVDKGEAGKSVVWKKVAPQFFYMPAVIFNTKTTGTALTRDLYQEYVNQFTGGAVGTGNATYNIAHGASGYSVPYAGGLVGSAGAPADIDVLGKNELYYYVSYYDTTVFANLSITADGVLKYDIIGNATPASYMNIVFVIK